MEIYQTSLRLSWGMGPGYIGRSSISLNVLAGAHQAVRILLPNHSLFSSDSISSSARFAAFLIDIEPDLTISSNLPATPALVGFLFIPYQSARPHVFGATSSKSGFLLSEE